MLENVAKDECYQREAIFAVSNYRSNNEKITSIALLQKKNLKKQ